MAIEPIRRLFIGYRYTKYMVLPLRSRPSLTPRGSLSEGDCFNNVDRCCRTSDLQRYESNAVTKHNCLDTCNWRADPGICPEHVEFSHLGNLQNRICRILSHCWETESGDSGSNTGWNSKSIMRRRRNAQYLSFDSLFPRDGQLTGQTRAEILWNCVKFGCLTGLALLSTFVLHNFDRYSRGRIVSCSFRDGIDTELTEQTCPNLFRIPALEQLSNTLQRPPLEVLLLACVVYATSMMALYCRQPMPAQRKDLLQLICTASSVLGVLAGIDAQGIAFSVLPLNVLVAILASCLAAWIGWERW